MKMQRNTLPHFIISILATAGLYFVLSQFFTGKEAVFASFFTVASVSMLIILYEQYRSEDFFTRNTQGSPRAVLSGCKYGVIGFIIAAPLAWACTYVPFFRGVNPAALTFSQAAIDHNTYAFITAVVTTGILVPPHEELIFRYYLFGNLEQTVPDHAVHICAALFAVMHPFSLSAVVFAFITGMVFTICYQKKRTIIAPISAHMCTNILGIILAYSHFPA